MPFFLFRHHDNTEPFTKGSIIRTKEGKTRRRERREEKNVIAI